MWVGPVMKATFEAFVGIRDDRATSQVKLFGDHLKVCLNLLRIYFVLVTVILALISEMLYQDLEQNLPMDNIYKSKDIVAAPIRVIQLIYNAGVSFEVGSY